MAEFEGERPTGGSEDAYWVRAQKDTFTAWVNDRLKSGKVGKEVGDLKTQFADGITLIKLLEVLAPTKKMLKWVRHVRGQAICYANTTRSA